MRGFDRPQLELRAVRHREVPDERRALLEGTGRWCGHCDSCRRAGSREEAAEQAAATPHGWDIRTLSPTASGAPGS